MEVNVGIRRAYVYSPPRTKIQIPEDYKYIEIGINDWWRARERLRELVGAIGEPRKKAIVLGEFNQYEAKLLLPVYHSASYICLILRTRNLKAGANRDLGGEILAISPTKKIADKTAHKLFGWGPHKLEKIVDTSNRKIITAGS